MSSIESSCRAKERGPVKVIMGAIANELHRDTHIFKQFPVCQHTAVIIPRLEKLTYLASTFPRTCAIIAYVSSKLWSPLLYPTLLLFQTISAVRHLGGNRTSPEGEVFFVNSKISLICARSATFKGKYIYFSKKLERAGLENESLGCITDYIVLSDVTRAFVNSVRALLISKSADDTPGAAFQVYVAFKWFLTWSVLHRIAGRLTSIWISSDCDRWAVLFDQLPTNAERIVVQHGLLNDPSPYSGYRNPVPLPTRLRNIDRVVLLDEDSEQLYRNLVLESDCSTGFTCSDGWLIRKAQDPNDRVDTSVMIIGQRGHLVQECALANYMAESATNARIYLRPHPDTVSERYKNRLHPRVVLIDNLHQFPDVALCICFDFSTLAHIYEKHGANVIYLKDLSDDQQIKERVKDQLMQGGFLS